MPCRVSHSATGVDCVEVRKSLKRLISAAVQWDSSRTAGEALAQKRVTRPIL